MPKNVDTTDLMVYGHEAWIETEQSDYAPGETVNAVLRWGHNMRPDGFCRADEFQIFYLDHNGEKVLLTPEKGNGDFYHIRFRAPDAGVYQLIAIYNNTYGHDGNDNWYEGVRRNLPLSETVTNYFQVYTTVFSIGTAHGTVPFYPESRIAFFLEDWSSNSEILRFRLMRDGAAEGLVSTTLVYFDGTEYTEKMLLTDRDAYCCTWLCDDDVQRPMLRRKEYPAYLGRCSGVYHLRRCLCGHDVCAALFLRTICVDAVQPGPRCD